MPPQDNGDASGREEGPGAKTAPSWGEAARFWCRLGWISFGGPAGQIAILHTELVERRRWVSEERFLKALHFCMLLPGPEATQLAIYIGWMLHRVPGGLIAGVLFILPSALLLWVLSVVYVHYGNVPWMAAAFDGMQGAVLGIVALALVRLGRRALTGPAMWGVALGAFLALVVVEAPYPLVVVGAAAGGWGLGWVRSRSKDGVPAGTGPGRAEGGGKEASPPAGSGGVRWAPSVRTLMIGLAVWWAPVAMLAGVLGAGHVVVQEALFFSRAALVTFGGAYAVLPYVAQQAVETHGWLGAEAMMDGLGLAETTPGPLIMVLQFVGFLGGWNRPGGLTPLWAGTLGAFITTWTTFVPSFLWILLGAPHVERLPAGGRMVDVLQAVTAGVVGVMLKLAVWFAGHVLVSGGRVDWFSLVVSSATFLYLTRKNASLPGAIAASVLLGMVRHHW